MTIASDIYAYAQLYEYYMEEDFSVWEGRDGTEYCVTQMDTSHIRNCLNMLSRYRDEGRDFTHREEWEKVFEKELENRVY